MRKIFILLSFIAFIIYSNILNAALFSCSETPKTLTITNNSKCNDDIYVKGCSLSGSGAIYFKITQCSSNHQIPHGQSYNVKYSVNCSTLGSITTPQDITAQLTVNVYKNGEYTPYNKQLAVHVKGNGSVTTASTNIVALSWEQNTTKTDYSKQDITADTSINGCYDVPFYNTGTEKITKLTLATNNSNYFYGSFLCSSIDKGGNCQAHLCIKNVTSNNVPDSGLTYQYTITGYDSSNTQAVITLHGRINKQSTSIHGNKQKSSLSFELVSSPDKVVDKVFKNYSLFDEEVKEYPFLVCNTTGDYDFDNVALDSVYDMNGLTAQELLNYFDLDVNKSYNGYPGCGGITNIHLSKESCCAMTLVKKCNILSLEKNIDLVIKIKTSDPPTHVNNKTLTRDLKFDIKLPCNPNAAPDTSPTACDNFIPGNAWVNDSGVVGAGGVKWGLVNIQDVINSLQNQPSNLQNLYTLFGTDDPESLSGTYLLRNSDIKAMKRTGAFFEDGYIDSTVRWHTVMQFTGVTPNVNGTDPVSNNNNKIYKYYPSHYIYNCSYYLALDPITDILSLYDNNPDYIPEPRLPDDCYDEFADHSMPECQHAAGSNYYYLVNGQKVKVTVPIVKDAPGCVYIDTLQLNKLSGSPYYTHTGDYTCSVKGTCNGGNCYSGTCKGEDGDGNIDGIWNRITLQELQNYHNQGYQYILIVFREGGDQSSGWAIKACTPGSNSALNGASCQNRVCQ